MRSRLARFSTSAAARWYVAIVGSGPAAFYTADQLLKNDPDVRVDLYERLPVPFGLVRYGVAPDHQDVKNVTDRFGKIASDPRCTLLGNVHVGGGGPRSAGISAVLPLDALRARYSAVVLACGADADRTLGVPGEELAGVHSAREFVEWYNGHPLGADRAFSLSSCETAVVVGHGNVALDCARVLCATADQLVGDTDIAAHAVEELAQSRVRQVVLLGRRSALHAAFTIKELREISKLSGATTTLVAPPDAFGAAVLAHAAKERPRKRLLELMDSLRDPDPAAHAQPLPPPPTSGPRRIRIQFQTSPAGFVAHGAEAGEAAARRLRAIRLQRTELHGEPSAAQRATAVAGSDYELPCELALRAVGYRSSPIDGAPFDSDRGVVPSSAGRVDGAPGLYVAGWLKRGPTGVILSNINDAAETAAAVLHDRAAAALDASGEAAGGCEAVRDFLAPQGAQIVGFDGWRKVDVEEMRRGEVVGKVREKVISPEEMLRIAAS